MAQISLAEVSELQGKGIDVLTSHVVDEHNAKSASNDPADREPAKADKPEAKPEAEKPKEQPKVDNGVQKRISELTRKHRDAERAVATERAEREKLAAEVARLREQADKANAPVRPKREDFEDQDAYVDALVDFKLATKSAAEATERAGKDSEADTKRRNEDAEQQEQEKAQEEAEQVIARFQGSLEKAKAAHPDFADVTNQPDVIVKPSLHAAMLHSEVGGELMYHFGKHPELVEKLNELDQASMLKELGKIELSLTSEEKKDGDGAVDQPRASDGKFAPKGKEISSAAAPIDPVKGSDETAGGRDPERMSVDAHRQAIAKAAGRLR